MEHKFRPTLTANEISAIVNALDLSAKDMEKQIDELGTRSFNATAADYYAYRERVQSLATRLGKLFDKPKKKPAAKKTKPKH